jgi:hypothetical protein
MNNFICTAALEKMALRIAAPIPDERAAQRYAALSRHALLNDPRTALPAEPEDLECAPAWALHATAEGRPLHIFCAEPELVAELRRGARALRDAWLEWRELRRIAPSNEDTRENMIARFAEDLFAKLDRMPLSVACEKARWISSERRRRKRAARADEQLFAPQEIYAAPGRVWRRVVSTAELSRIGSEMHNCLAARSGRHNHYARRLAADTARYWVLRDERGAALAVVMLNAPEPRLLEARAPRNAPISRSDPAFRILLDACGIVLPPPRITRRTAPLIEEVAMRLRNGPARAPTNRDPARRDLTHEEFRAIFLGLDRALERDAPIRRLPAR